MATNKNQQNDGDVHAYLNSVEHDRRREDSLKVLEIMQEVTGEEPKMWGDSMVGFGKYHYTYASGREGEWFLTGFAPRKQSLTIYIQSGFDQYGDLLEKIGKHKTSKVCLYVNKLENLDESVLRELIAKSVEHMRETNKTS